MKRYISANAAVLTANIRNLIRQYNAHSDHHISIKNGNYRYNTYEHDLYKYGSLNNLITCLVELLHQDGVSDVTEISEVDLAGYVEEAAYDAADTTIGAHHHFEVSDMPRDKRELDSRYGFGSALDQDDSYKMIARRLMEYIYQLAADNGITIYRKLSDANFNAQPAIRRCTISSYYSGVFIYLATERDFAEPGHNPGYKRLKQLVIQHIDDIEQYSGAHDIQVKQNIVFTY